MAVIIAKDSCIGCGVCADECPAGALSIVDDIATVDEGACLDCGICTESCPQEAVALPA